MMSSVCLTALNSPHRSCARMLFMLFAAELLWLGGVHRRDSFAASCCHDNVLAPLTQPSKTSGCQIFMAATRRDHGALLPSSETARQATDRRDKADAESRRPTSCVPSGPIPSETQVSCTFLGGRSRALVSATPGSCQRVRRRGSQNSRPMRHGVYVYACVRERVCVSVCGCVCMRACVCLRERAIRRTRPLWSATRDQSCCVTPRTPSSV